MRQKGFAFIPILLVSIFLGVLGFSIYSLYSFEPKTKSSQVVKPSPTKLVAEKPSPSTQTEIEQSFATNLVSDSEFTLDSVTKLQPKVTWQEPSRSELESYEYNTVKGEEVKGDFTLNTNSEDFFSYFTIYREEKHWVSQGWKDDGSLAADGATGSSWGYYQDKGGQRRILNFHYDIDHEDGERLFKARETQTEFKCPCKYKVEVFLSDWFNYIPVE